MQKKALTYKSLYGKEHLDKKNLDDDSGENFVEIARKGGGIGLNVSSLRPSGDFVEGAQAIASGPCSFV